LNWVKKNEAAGGDEIREKEGKHSHPKKRRNLCVAFCRALFGVRTTEGSGHKVEDLVY